MNEKQDQERPTFLVILGAAADEFLSHGFSGTSMERIAESAGVSKRTVYNHFPSKESLFQAILAELRRRIGDTEYVEYSRVSPLAGQLKVIGGVYAATISAGDFIKLARVLIAEAIQNPAFSRATMVEQHRLRQNIVSWIKAGKTDGRLSVQNPDLAAAQFCGSIRELAFWPQLMGGQPPISVQQRQALVNTSVEVFLGHYGSDGAVEQIPIGREQTPTRVE